MHSRPTFDETDAHGRVRYGVVWSARMRVRDDRCCGDSLRRKRRGDEVELGQPWLTVKMLVLAP